jgi:hypothetical protein
MSSWHLNLVNVLLSNILISIMKYSYSTNYETSFQNIIIFNSEHIKKIIYTNQIHFDIDFNPSNTTQGDMQTSIIFNRDLISNIYIFIQPSFSHISKRKYSFKSKRVSINVV